MSVHRKGNRSRERRLHEFVPNEIVDDPIPAPEPVKREQKWGVHGWRRRRDRETSSPERQRAADLKRLRRQERNLSNKIAQIREPLFERYTRPVDRFGRPNCRAPWKVAR